MAGLMVALAQVRALTVARHRLITGRRGKARQSTRKRVMRVNVEQGVVSETSCVSNLAFFETFYRLPRIRFSGTTVIDTLIVFTVCRGFVCSMWSKARAGDCTLYLFHRGRMGQDSSGPVPFH